VTEKSGADILIEALTDLGVEVVFGYPGGAVLPIYDAIFKQDRIKHILVRHEQAATHAAEGYARSTGKPGVVLVTSGPGATNAVTGITDALMDSIPMVVITGQVPTALIGTDAFQEADTVGITRHCTKHNYLVKDPETLGSVIHEAFHIATSGRPGPVVVDIPKDVQVATARYETPGPDPAQDLSPADPARRGEDPGSGRHARRGRAPDLLHRRRDHQFGSRSLAPAARAGRNHRRAGHLDADGARRLPGLVDTSGSACSACTAPMKPIGR
jgi:thiamine pyrophosphate-dependent acetolactate synthase large subunit-like protein